MTRRAIRIGAAVTAALATAFLAGEVVVVQPALQAAARAADPESMADLLRWRLAAAACASCLGAVGWSVWAGATRRRSEERAARRRIEVVGMVAHDLRGPLTGIRLAAERRTRSGDAAATTAAIHRECDRLEAIADDILTACVAVDAEAVPTDDEPLCAVLEDVARRVRATTGATLDLRVEPGLAELGADRHLARALGNIVENAARHARRAPVGVVVRRIGDDVEIAVADDGPGFDPGYAIRSFRSGRVRGRAGLGLASALRVARRLGGTLVVERGSEGGAVVSMRVPDGARR